MRNKRSGLCSVCGAFILPNVGKTFFDGKTGKLKNFCPACSHNKPFTTKEVIVGDVRDFSSDRFFFRAILKSQNNCVPFFKLVKFVMGENGPTPTPNGIMFQIAKNRIVEIINRLTHRKKSENGKLIISEKLKMRFYLKWEVLRLMQAASDMVENGFPEGSQTT
jgi:hypothetical protein